MSLSKYLLATAGDYDSMGVWHHSEDEKKEALERERILKELAALFVSSRLGFASRCSAEMDRVLSAAKDHGIIDEYLDFNYSVDLLKLVPKIVARTIRLSRLTASQTPATATDVFLTEATRSYVFGFWNASVALSRAAVEQALREKVESRVSLKNPKLCDLVTAAYRLKLLDDEHQRLASQVELVGNKVVHGKPSNDRESWVTLSDARQVLDHIYGDEG